MKNFFYVSFFLLFACKIVCGQDTVIHNIQLKEIYEIAQNTVLPLDSFYYDRTQRVNYFDFLTFTPKRAKPKNMYYKLYLQNQKIVTISYTSKKCYGVSMNLSYTDKFIFFSLYTPQSFGTKVYWLSFHNGFIIFDRLNKIYLFFDTFFSLDYLESLKATNINHVKRIIILDADLHATKEIGFEKGVISYVAKYNYSAQKKKEIFSIDAIDVSKYHKIDELDLKSLFETFDDCTKKYPSSEVMLDEEKCYNYCFMWQCDN